MEKKSSEQTSRMELPPFKGGLGRVSGLGRVPRGIRNNNPCNIRKGGAKWQGEVQMVNGHTDRSFCLFESMTMGLRATFKLLKNYRHMYRIYCIEEIVYRWAPPQDHNATEAYIDFVEKQTGIPRKRILTYPDYMKVVKAMCKIESNYSPADDVLEEAFHMVFG